MFDGFEPLHTKIEKIISLRTGNVILEDHAMYPLSESNLYYMGEKGEVVWYAEKPAPDAHYTRVKLNADGATLSAYTTGRHACELDLKTGKLLSHIGFE